MRIWNGSPRNRRRSVRRIRKATMAEKTNTLRAQLNTARRERERTQEALTNAMLSLQQAEHQCDRIRRDSGRLDAERQELPPGAGRAGPEEGVHAKIHRDRLRPTGHRNWRTGGLWKTWAMSRPPRKA